MLPSNFGRLVLMVIFVGVITACANKGTVKPGTENTKPGGSTTESATQPASESGGEAPSAQNNLVDLPVTADPMAVELPLPLIKDYDQVTSLIAAKNIPQAISQLQQIQQKYPQQSGPSYRLARIYLQQKNYQDALKAVDSSLLINPNNYYALNLKGVVLRELGRFGEAKDAYLNALKVYPRFPQSHLNLAILADIYLYDLPLALKHYEYYLSLSEINNDKIKGWVIDLKRRMPE